jgi:hypothetical protein
MGVLVVLVIVVVKAMVQLWRLFPCVRVSLRRFPEFLVLQEIYHAPRATLALSRGVSPTESVE